ncbi:aldose 1-epimerase, partial [Pseudomonas syringae pv. japonica str. M301072]
GGAGACQRVFEHAGAVQLQDPIWQRRLNIDTGDSPNTVVWHPGSRPLLGVCGSETTGFVRVEAASGSGDTFSLRPGEQVQLKLQASLAG